MSPAAKDQHASSHVLTATLLGLLVPGGGHLFLRRWRSGALLLGLMAAGLAVAIWHLVVGLSLFESNLGSFCFGVMLRGLAILHAFSVLDAHLSARRPGESGHQRLAVVLNLLVPGTGYLVARTWIRGATGLLLLVLVIYFAKAGINPYLDLIYVGMQLVMGAAVFMQFRMRDAQNEQAPAARGPLPPRVVQIAQLVVLVAVSCAVVAFGYVTQRALPNVDVRWLTAEDIRTRPVEEGILLSVPRLGLSLKAAGTGWTTEIGKDGFLFSAEHEKGPTLMVGIRNIPPFVRSDRVVRRVRQMMEGKANRLVYLGTKQIRLNEAPATKMLFSRDHWIVTVPQDKFIFIVMLGCHPECGEGTLSLRQQTLDSFALK